MAHILLESLRVPPGGDRVAVTTRGRAGPALSPVAKRTHKKAIDLQSLLAEQNGEVIRTMLAEAGLLNEGTGRSQRRTLIRAHPRHLLSLHRSCIDTTLRECMGHFSRTGRPYNPHASLSTVLQKPSSGS
jgi:hypothetical protein